MARFMSALVSKQFEESMDVQVPHFESKDAALAQLAEDADGITIGGLFWEFVADEMLLDDDE